MMPTISSSSTLASCTGCSPVHLALASYTCFRSPSSGSPLSAGMTAGATKSSRPSRVSASSSSRIKHKVRFFCAHSTPLFKVFLLTALFVAHHPFTQNTNSMVVRGGGDDPEATHDVCRHPRVGACCDPDWPSLSHLFCLPRPCHVVRLETSQSKQLRGRIQDTNSRPNRDKLFKWSEKEPSAWGFHDDVDVFPEDKWRSVLQN